MIQFTNVNVTNAYCAQAQGNLLNLIWLKTSQSVVMGCYAVLFLSAVILVRLHHSLLYKSLLFPWDVTFSLRSLVTFRGTRGNSRYLPHNSCCNVTFFITSNSISPQVGSQVQFDWGLEAPQALCAATCWPLSSVSWYPPASWQETQECTRWQLSFQSTLSSTWRWLSWMTMLKSAASEIAETPLPWPPQIVDFPVCWPYIFHLSFNLHKCSFFMKVKCFHWLHFLSNFVNNAI